MTARGIGIWSILVVVFGTMGVARGADFFDLTAQTTSGPAQTVTGGSASLLNILDKGIQSQGIFSSLNGRDISASLSYAGLPRTIVITRNAAGTTGTLSFPSTGFVKTFVGTSAQNLKNQLDDFLKHTGATELGDLNAKLNATSKVAVVDGNPQSAVALMGDDAFFRWGLPQPHSVYRTGQFWVDGYGGAIQADGLNGAFGVAAIGNDFSLSRDVGFSIDLTGQYREIANAEAFSLVGSDMGFPITLVRSPMMTGWFWQVTPFAFFDAALSKDQVSGGALFGTGATNSVTYRIGDFAFTMGNQFSYTTGADVGLADLSLKPGPVDQWLIKNGVNVMWSPGEHVFVDGGVAYSNFTKSAGVPSWVTPTFGLGWRFSENSSIRAGFEGDYGNGYSATAGTLSLLFTW